MQKEGEHPSKGLARILSQELGVKKFGFSPAPRVFSYYSRSSLYPNKHHWDLAFVYSVKLFETLKKKNCWEELCFTKMSELNTKSFGWNVELVRDLGLVK